MSGPMVDEPLLCGIDAGTSQTRALLFTPSGRIVAHAAEPATVWVPATGQAEIDALRISVRRSYTDTS